MYVTTRDPEEALIDTLSGSFAAARVHFAVLRISVLPKQKGVQSAERRKKLRRSRHVTAQESFCMDTAPIEAKEEEAREEGAASEALECEKNITENIFESKSDLLHPQNVPQAVDSQKASRYAPKDEEIVAIKRANEESEKHRQEERKKNWKVVCFLLPENESAENSLSDERVSTSSSSPSPPVLSLSLKERLFIAPTDLCKRDRSLRKSSRPHHPKPKRKFALRLLKNPSSWFLDPVALDSSVSSVSGGAASIQQEDDERSLDEESAAVCDYKEVVHDNWIELPKIQESSS
ncbi:uncharacterized protein [Oscarella lobularis]|uniref:uncharacterized protein n=1 Tax=Oscarella lobularis TaxID=121494 RepID=UPI003313EDC7